MSQAMQPRQPLITPLDGWMAARLGVPAPLARSRLEEWQYARLREVLALAQGASPFHARRLAGVDGNGLRTPADLQTLPMMTAEDIRRHGRAMLCISQDEVARVVSLKSSGTTGPAKRIAFSAEDLELTLDFFAHGMSTFTRSGQGVLIMLPGTTPDSTGALLSRALERLGARGVVHGLAMDPEQAIRSAREERTGVLVGFPVHVLAMARLCEDRGIRLPVSEVLLCSDYIPQSVVNEVERIWPCRVFSHWGAVETGLGGGVECEARQGCHLREADLLVEVVNPETGAPLPDGCLGEVVVTTLTRRAMPLIRYRTGDLARIIDEPCPCGSVVRRLDKVQGRMDQMASLPGGRMFGMNRLDELLLDVPGVLDVQASLAAIGCNIRLGVRLCALEGYEASSCRTARMMLEAMPEMNTPTRQGPMELEYVAAMPWTSMGISPAKRTFIHRTVTS